MSGNHATPPEQDDDRGSKVCDGQWYPYIVRWRDGEQVAVYEPLEADAGP